MYKGQDRKAKKYYQIYKESKTSSMQMFPMLQGQQDSSDSRGFCPTAAQNERVHSANSHSWLVTVVIAA